MKAFALVEPQSRAARYIDLPDPVVGPNDVLVKLEVAGICGTDLKVWDWAPNIAARVGGSLPRIMGHEGAGIVAAVGSDVRNVAPGNRVVPISMHWCGQCRFCQAKQSEICDNRPTLGIEYDGLFAEYVAVPSEQITPLPPHISFEVGSLLDPIATGLQALMRVPVTSDDVVAVVGAGPIGFLVALAVQAYSPKRLFMFGLEVDRERLRHANSAGIEAIEAQDPAVALKAVQSVSGGYGADIVFEAAGHPSGILTAIDLVRKGGKVGLMGLPKQSTEINTATLIWAEKTLVPVRGFSKEAWDQAVKYLSEGRVDFTPMITHRMPMADAAKGLAMVERREALKVMLTP